MSDENTSLAPEAVVDSVESPKPAESVEEIAAKVESGAPLSKKEEKKLKEYKLKVDGKEKSIKLDLSNDEEITKYLQKAEASDKKFAEAAEVRKAAISFIDELKKNPRKVLSDPNIGVDLKKFAEEIMNEALQEMEKSPEQREHDKLKKELEDIKKQRDDEKKSSDEKEFTRLQVEHERQLETEITAALDVGGLPKTPRTVKAMAEMMMIALQNGIDLSPQEIAPIVKNTTMGEFKDIVNSLSDDQLEDFMGDAIKRLQKKRVAKVKSVESASSIKATASAPKKEEPKADKKLTIREFLKI